MPTDGRDSDGEFRRPCCVSREEEKGGGGGSLQAFIGGECLAGGGRVRAGEEIDGQGCRVHGLDGVQRLKGIPIGGVHLLAEGRDREDTLSG
jgi:hypothetical protein